MHSSSPLRYPLLSIREISRGGQSLSEIHVFGMGKAIVNGEVNVEVIWKKHYYFELFTGHNFGREQYLKANLYKLGHLIQDIV